MVEAICHRFCHGRRSSDGAGIAGTSGNSFLDTVTLTQTAAASGDPTIIERRCVECHLSKDTLESLAVDEPIIGETGGCGAPPPNIPKSEKLLVGEDFLDDIHGKLACVSCHQGASPGNMESSHQGMVRDPSIDDKACGGCHQDYCLKVCYGLTQHYARSNNSG